MKEFIVEYETEQLGNNTFFYGGKIKRELIQCNDCRYRIVTASIEHEEGDVTNYYMCDYWHRPTDEDGYCHVAKRKGRGKWQ